MAHRRSLQRRLVSLVIALTALVGVGGLAGSASATGSQIGLSNDGVSFADRLAQPIFPREFVWVPGDAMVRSFYVRNQSQDAGDLMILMGERTGAMARSGALKIDTRLPGRSWTPLDSTPTKVDRPLVIGPGRQTRIDVQVTYLGSATNDTQLLGTDLGFVVNLSQDVTQVAAPSRNPLAGLDAPIFGDPRLELLVLTIAAATAYGARRHRRQRLRALQRTEDLSHA